MKIGRHRESNGDWQLNIRGVPKKLGDDLEMLWKDHVEEAKEEGTKPLGWHAFLISILAQYRERAYAIGDLRSD